jgi:hypothetical protein
MTWDSHAHSSCFILPIVDFVLENVLRVYTHGSPPVAFVKGNSSSGSSTTSKQRFTGRRTDKHDLHACPVLEAFDLPSHIVYGYIQPYVRSYDCVSGSPSILLYPRSLTISRTRSRSHANATPHNNEYPPPASPLYHRIPLFDS